MSYLYWMLFLIVGFLIIGLPGLYLFSEEMLFTDVIINFIVLWVSVTVVYLIIKSSKNKKED